MLQIKSLDEPDQVIASVAKAKAHVVNLGTGSSHIEYVLRLGRDFSLGGPVNRLRFEVIECAGGLFHSSNGVVWTVRW
jgi:hypothetical protein